MIHDALGDARTVLNIGAGTGSYEPAEQAGDRHRAVAGNDPQAKPPAAAPAIQASAGDLPFADKSFDAAMAILTLNCHWPDKQNGPA